MENTMASLILLAFLKKEIKPLFNYTEKIG